MAKVEDIAWSSRSYELRELIKDCTFPVLVKVITGYCASNEVDSLANGQVLRIHRIQRQPRVITVDKRGRNFSIPVKFTFSKFDILRGDYAEGEPRYLWEIIERNMLPVDVQFASNDNLIFSLQYIDDAVKLGDNFGRLTLTTLYDESYLQGNAINDGALDKTVINIPMHTKLNVVVAQGLKRGSPERWNRMCAMLDSAVKKKVDFKSSPGNLDISLFSQRNLDATEQHHYEELEPHGTLTIRSRTSGTRTLKEKPASPPKLPERPASFRKSKEGLRVNAPSQENVVSLSPATVEEMNVPGKYNIYTAGPFRRTGRPASFSAATAVSSGIHPDAAEPEKGDPVLPRKQKEAKTADQGIKPRPTQSLRVRKKVSFILDDIPNIEPDVSALPFSIPPPDYDMDSTDRRMIDSNSHLGMGGQSGNPESRWNSDVPDGEYLYATPFQAQTANQGHVKEPTRSSQTTTSLNNNEENGPDMSRLMSELQQAQKKLRKVSLTSPGDSKNGPTAGADSEYPSLPRKYKSLSQVPSALDTLTVQDVCECLILLNMENYTGKFRSNLVDGEMLMYMDTEMMTEGLAMTTVDAKRLQKFTEGWRPK